MSNIYVSSFVDGPELDSENLIESFEDYALKLEEVAQDYRNLVDYIKSKDIKILEAHGFSHGGFFKVDDIDTNRLKQAGFVIDYADGEPEDDKKAVFYIDEEFEEAMEELTDELDEMGPPLFDMLEPDFEEDEDDEEDEFIFGEKTKCFSLKEAFESFDDQDNPRIGKVGVEIEKYDNAKFNFNFILTDINKNPSLVQFDREECVFKYKCGSCDAWHLESLDAVYKSLKTANALLSNLMVMAGDCKELFAGFDFVDHDLRLLQALLRFDYAMDDGDLNNDELP